MEKRIFFNIILFLTLIFFIGCLTRVGGRSIPEVDPNYTPKEIYSVDYNRAWEDTLKALKENRIPIDSVNKVGGLIKTNYQPGPEILLLDEVFWTRYKYNINILKKTENKTKIVILCTYEVKRGSKGTYTDTTASSPKTVLALEQELLKKIEAYFP